MSRLAFANVKRGEEDYKRYLRSGEMSMQHVDFEIFGWLADEKAFRILQKSGQKIFKERRKIKLREIHDEAVKVGEELQSRFLSVIKFFGLR